jgi:integration host factor subunit beta
MTRSELVARIARQNPALTEKEVDIIIDAFFSTLHESLAEGNRVELRGFGIFSVRHRDARMARNPKTGEQVQVGAHYALHFKMGKSLKERLNRADKAHFPL